MDLTLADCQHRLMDLALHQTVRENLGRQTSYAKDALHRELLESMTAEAPAYIAALSPIFDAAIAEFVTAAELGIAVHSNAEDAMALGPDGVAAWMAISGPKGMAKALDGLAGIRIRMSTALGVPPVNRYSGEAAVMYGTAFGAAATFDQLPGWRRWLSIASTGAARLVTLDELAEA